MIRNNEITKTNNCLIGELIKFEEVKYEYIKKCVIRTRW